MNYISLTNGSGTCLFNHTGDISHAIVHGRGVRTRLDAATSPSIAMYGISTDCATETSPKKEAQIVQIKTTAITVSSYRGSYT